MDTAKVAQPPGAPPCILGIDPGLNVTGYAVLEVSARGPVVREAGVIRGRDRRSLPSRLADMYDGVREVLAGYRPVGMAIEALYSHYQRPRTSILMGHARGAIVLAAQQAGVPVLNYSATQVKKTLTGNGRAGKAQMQRAVQQELRLDTVPEPHDVSDALAIALCHYYRQPEWVAAARRRA